jgi:hypothetical protein
MKRWRLMMKMEVEEVRKKVKNSLVKEEEKEEEKIMKG